MASCVYGEDAKSNHMNESKCFGEDAVNQPLCHLLSSLLRPLACAFVRSDAGLWEETQMNAEDPPQLLGICTG